MHIAYLFITILFAAMVAFSAVAKVRRDPKVVHVIEEVVGVPPKHFPLLAACEFAGALGLVLGIWLPWAGLAAGLASSSILWARSWRIFACVTLKALGPPCSC